MSRIAKGPPDPLFKNKRSRTIAKGDGLGLRLVCKLETGKPSTWCRGLLGFCAGPEKTVMRNPIDIDISDGPNNAKSTPSTAIIASILLAASTLCLGLFRAEHPVGERAVPADRGHEDVQLVELRQHLRRRGWLCLA